MLVLEGVLGLHRTGQLQLLWLQWLGIDLDYCDVEWLALETHQDHSVIFEIAPKYYISASFVDCDGYSISSKEFLPMCMLGCSHGKSLKPCLSLCHPMDCSLPSSSVHRILQARILDWVAMPSYRASSQPRD